MDQSPVGKASNDHRPESHKIFIDTITCDGTPISTKRSWEARRSVLSSLDVHHDFAALDEARVHQGLTLGLLRPNRISGLEISPADKSDWTDEERNKLLQHEQQAALFDETDAKRIATLRKVPFDLYYRYTCGNGEGTREYRHKIVDWEAGALYWKCRQSYGKQWERPFRAKLGEAIPAADLIFLMGTIYRFPNQWLIVSLLYPPKQPIGQPTQESLFGW